MNMIKEKNKQWLSLLVGISLLTGLVACTGETLLSPSGEGKPVIVNAEINSDQPVTEITRAQTEENTYDRSTFITSDKIRITRTTLANKSEAADYQLGEDGQWTSTSTPLTLLAGASYQAVYPAGNDAGIMYDQSSVDNYIKSNRLVSASIKAPETEILKFVFDHQNTKLTLEFNPKVSGEIPPDFSFQVSAPGLRTGGADSEPIKLFRPNDESLTWCGIVFPKNAETTITVTLTYNGVNYNSTFKCLLAPKTHYKYTLSIHNNILVPEANGILGWTDEINYTGPIE